ncbi:MAG TPA: homocysteine S-methyltransferase family protein [Solirubrobacterales bacterium]|nr:homocysteine S-methyltransferase family protein [Solirubrobacterales bacterium]
MSPRAGRRLPTGERLFIGDGGLETTLIFREGLDLPEFASYVLLRDPAGVEALRRYYGDYLEIARRRGIGFTFDTPTWRANADWGEKLGDSAEALADVNRKAVALAEEIRAAEESMETPIAICGTIGPRGDAYQPEELMSAEEAERYHGAQISTFAGTAADLVGAYTLAYAEEAIGIVRAAVANEMPVMISFTLETDGKLPSGQPLDEAIELVDAETDGAVAYFMINCAHPSQQEPRRARRSDRAGPRRPGRARRRIPGAEGPAPERPRAGRLLWQRPAPRRQHLRRLAGLS